MIKIICVAYCRLLPLQTLINSFLCQTGSNNHLWELNIIHDGKPPDDILSMVRSYKDIPVDTRFGLNFTWSTIRVNNFGHPNRRMMLEKLECEPHDFILMTNDDNYYVPVFIDEMIKAIAPDTGIVSCNTIHSHFGYTLHESRMVEMGIDMGAFIVRADIAKHIGFNHDHFSADGAYAKECADYCISKNLKIIHIPKPLFVHN